MPLDFQPIRLADQARYRELFAACPAPTSDYTFANLWGWREHYLLEWAFEDGLAWIRQNQPEKAVWAPIGDWSRTDWASLSCLAGLKLVRVPAPLKDLLAAALPGRVSAEEAREHFDYVYSVQDLVELRGNKFHKKKNLLAQFLRNYAFVYHPMTPDCVEGVLQMQEEWCSWRDCESGNTLVSENEAIRRVLENWDNMPGMFGGVIEVDKRIVAYTVAERLDQKSLVIHFEKGHAQFKGIYQAINQLFLANEAGEFALVNREQDLDDPGLRKAKESYNPVDYLKKYEVLVAPAQDAR